MEAPLGRLETTESNSRDRDMSETLAPATGTPEAGGWTVREVKRIIRGLSGLNFVGAEIVEVAPAYDHADITSIAAADIAQDFIAMMLTSAPPSRGTSASRGKMNCRA
ncbi:Arginase/deacetylase [Peniophora sp. CONT]|nr:Arginase/deacetylase [Peniophora sp. CONT]